MTVNTVFVDTRLWKTNPCKMGSGIPPRFSALTGIPPGSRRGGPFSRRDPSREKFPPRISVRISPRNLYSPRSRQEKNSPPGSRRESHLEQNLGSVPGENLVRAEKKLLHSNSRREVAHSRRRNPNPGEARFKLRSSDLVLEARTALKLS